MSSLVRTLRPSLALLSPVRPMASFHTSSIRRAMSESDHAKDDPDRASKIDSHKHDSLNKVKSGDAEWKPELASNSEQGVRADKENKSMKEMQDEGAKKAQASKEPSSSR